MKIPHVKEPDEINGHVIRRKYAENRTERAEDSGAIQSEKTV